MWPFTVAPAHPTPAAALVLSLHTAFLATASGPASNPWHQPASYSSTARAEDRAVQRIQQKKSRGKEKEKEKEKEKNKGCESHHPTFQAPSTGIA